MIGSQGSDSSSSLKPAYRVGGTSPSSSTDERQSDDQRLLTCGLKPPLALAHRVERSPRLVDKIDQSLGVLHGKGQDDDPSAPMDRSGPQRVDFVIYIQYYRYKNPPDEHKTQQIVACLRKRPRRDPTSKDRSRSGSMGLTSMSVFIGEVMELRTRTESRRLARGVLRGGATRGRPFMEMIRLAPVAKVLKQRVAMRCTCNNPSGQLVGSRDALPRSRSRAQHALPDRLEAGLHNNLPSRSQQNMKVLPVALTIFLALWAPTTRSSCSMSVLVNRACMYPVAEIQEPAVGPVSGGGPTHRNSRVVLGRPGLLLEQIDHLGVVIGVLGQPVHPNVLKGRERPRLVLQESALCVRTRVEPQ